MYSWVFSVYLDAEACRGHSVYDPQRSTTFEELDDFTWEMRYADGDTASGIVGTDKVEMSGVTVTRQAIEMATAVSSRLAKGYSDGLVGLASFVLNRVRPVRQYTFFENVRQSLEQPLFAAYLPKFANGAYDFGRTDSTRYEGDLLYTDLATPPGAQVGWWEFESQYFKIGDDEYTIFGWHAIVDTGTALILMDDFVVNSYYEEIPNSFYSVQDGGWMFPCSATIPSLSIQIGSAGYATLTGNDLIYAVVERNYCFGALQSVGSESERWGDQAVYDQHLDLPKLLVENFAAAGSAQYSTPIYDLAIINYYKPTAGIVQSRTLTYDLRSLPSPPTYDVEMINCCKPTIKPK